MNTIVIAPLRVSPVCCCFYLLLLVPFLFQSCASPQEVAASGDYSHQSYSGPSYSSSSNNDSRINANAAYFISVNLSLGLAQQPIPPNMGNKMGKGGPSDADNPEPDDYAAGQRARSYSSPAEKTEVKPFSRFTAKGGLEYVMKSSKDGDTKINLNYLEVPLYALYNYRLRSGDYLLGGLGPYFAYGVGGKIKANFDGQTIKANSFDKDGGFKRFDAGLGITAGYQMINSFSFRLAYEIGFVNLAHSDFGDKVRNRSLSFVIGYPVNRLFRK